MIYRKFTKITHRQNSLHTVISTIQSNCFLDSATLYCQIYIVLHFIHPCVYFLNNTIEYREMDFCKIRISIVHARYLYINSIRHDWPFPKESQHTMRILRYHMTSSRDLIERSNVQITSASVSFVNNMTYRT